MHALVLALHNILRWLVILTAVVALIRSLRGMAAGLPWTRREALSLTAYASILTLQMVLGLVLYFVLSPLGMPALSDMGAVMRDPEMRLFAVEHPLTSMLAVAFAHIAVARSRKALTDASRYRGAALLLTLSLVLLLARMPWARPLLPSF
jgi:hypothetical protein